jgi:SAM-dependent methyltransferase
MSNKLLYSYTDPSKHAATADMIRRLSTNKTDIRELALFGLDMASYSDILDLGCGYGFMSSMVASKAAKGTHIIGVDACEENRSPFIDTVSRYGCKAQFETMSLENELPWDTDRFHMILCSYSLYFFVDLIGEIARVLKQDGIFISITHSEKSFNGLYEASGLIKEESPMAILIGKFSSENGREKLAPFFMEIEKIEFSNSLHFDSSHLDYLKEYLQFKLPLLRSDSNLSEGLTLDMERQVENTFVEKGRVIVEKHDAIFRSRRPVCR